MNSDASDINSIAGVLKLYLRELREPLFPTIYFDHFMIIAQLESKEEFLLFPVSQGQCSHIWSRGRAPPGFY